MTKINCRVGFVTSIDYPQLASDDHLLYELASGIWHCDILVWTDKSIDWSIYDLLIIRSLWDYVPKYQEFNQWFQSIEDMGIQILNTFDMIRWNSNKNYLREMNEKDGIDVIPSLYITTTNKSPTIIIDNQINNNNKFVLGGGSSGSASSSASSSSSTCSKSSLLDYINYGVKIGKFSILQKRFVMKPCVGANSYGTHEFTLSNWKEYQEKFSELLNDSDMIIQPFVESVLDQGEISFIFFNGRFSHSIIKRPRQDDFRVQEDHGGSVELNPNPPQSEIDIAQKVINYITKVKGKSLYARIDMLRYNNKLCLGESELFEPTLYFMKDETIVLRFLTALSEFLPKRSASMTPQATHTASALSPSSLHPQTKPYRSSSTSTSSSPLSTPHISFFTPPSTPTFLGAGTGKLLKSNHSYKDNSSIIII